MYLLCLGDAHRSNMQKKHYSLELFHKVNENIIISKFGILVIKSSLPQ